MDQKLGENDENHWIWHQILTVLILCRNHVDLEKNRYRNSKKVCSKWPEISQKWLNFGIENSRVEHFPRKLCFGTGKSCFVIMISRFLDPKPWTKSFLSPYFVRFFVEGIRIVRPYNFYSKKTKVRV
jgi:hypothetical protein